MEQQSPLPTRRVLVVGGRGFLGRRTVDALRALPGLDVHISARRLASGSGDGRPEDGRPEDGYKAVELDLNRPETFAAFDGFDAVVNCADALAAPPLAASRHCRTRGILFVESTADADTIETLLVEHGRAAIDGDGDGDGDGGDKDDGGAGAVLVGVGLFPGLSNLMATQVAERAAAAAAAGDDDRNADTDPAPPIAIEIGIDPLSGAGRGTIELMVKVAGDADVRMPEPIILAASRGADNVQVELVPVMRWARPMARLAGRMTPRNRIVRSVLAFMTRVVMIPLRRLVFRKRRGRITISARCGAERLELVTRRGFEATAEAIAATTWLCLNSPPEPGCHPLDRAVDIRAVVTQMRTVPGCDVVIEPALAQYSAAEVPDQKAPIQRACGKARRGRWSGTSNR